MLLRQVHLPRSMVGARRHTVGSRKLRSWPGSVFITVVLAYLYIPLAAVLALSVNDSQFSTFPMQGLTSRWYGEVLGAGPYRSAFFTSVEVALIVTGAALLVGIPAAFAIARRRFALRPLLSVALVACLGLPGHRDRVRNIWRCENPTSRHRWPRWCSGS